MMMARKKAMTEIEALVEALTRFDGAAAARIDWERLFPDWDSSVRQRYVHNSRSAAAGVLCPEGRPGCYQELRENKETGEWRAVCGRDSEECARRTLTRQQVAKWALDVRTLCQDITDSLKTGAIPHECAPGVWDCGQIRVETKQAGILFVVGGDGLSERLACARGIYDGAGVVIPCIKHAHKASLAICESGGSVVLGLAEHCRVEQGRVAAKSLEGWANVLAGVHGTGMKVCVRMDTPRGMTVGDQPIEADASAVLTQLAEHKECLDSIHDYVKNIPKMRSDLDEARLIPEHATLEMFKRIQNILTPEEQRIWTAIREAGGVQKDSLPSLREAKIVNSEPTLSRMVKKIDKKLKEHGLPPCKASGPMLRHKKSGGYTDADGNKAPVEISSAITDWREDPDERKRIIRGYLAAKNSEDRKFYTATYPDIVAEAKKYKGEAGMKSG